MQHLSTAQFRWKVGSKSKTAVYEDFRLGRLPKPIKIGDMLYWNEAEVDAAMEAHRVAKVKISTFGPEQSE